MKPVNRTICLLKDPRFGTRVLSGVCTKGYCGKQGPWGQKITGLISSSTVSKLFKCHLPTQQPSVASYNMI